MQTDFVLDALEQTLCARRRDHHRLLEPIGSIPPAEAEANYWRLRDQASITTTATQSAALQEG